MSPIDSTVMVRLQEGPDRLEKALADTPDKVLDSVPGEGGWTIRQIVHHIADGDDIWKLGLKAALGNIQAEFTLDWYLSQPQTTWSERWGYADRSLDISLELIKVTRRQIAQLVESIPDAWDRTLRFRNPDGKVEELTAGFIVGMQADHLEHHLRRIEELKQAATGP